MRNVDTPFGWLTPAGQREKVVSSALSLLRSSRVKVVRTTFLTVSNSTTFLPLQIYRSDLETAHCCTMCLIGSLIGGLLLNQTDQDVSIADLVDSAPSLEERYPYRTIKTNQINLRRRYYTALRMFDLTDLTLLESVYLGHMVEDNGTDPGLFHALLARLDASLGTTAQKRSIDLLEMVARHPAHRFALEEPTNAADTMP